MNYSDSERLKTVLERIGYKETLSPNKADLIIMNSCSVRQHAEDRIFGFINEYEKIRKKNPQLKIGLTGCMVRKTSIQKDKEKDNLLSRIKHLDFVIRTEEMIKLPQIIGIKSSKKTNNFNTLESRELKNYFHINPKYESKFQAFVPISTGCDKFCAYCIVPYARGREKFRSKKEILEETRSLAKNGCKEITLVGQTVNSYPKFANLLKEIDKFHKFGLERVRFVSPYPPDTDDDLIDAMANLKTLMPYIHLPIQSGSNEILRRMNRKYTVEQYEKIIEKIRAKIPDCAISTDIIVGFCGETREQFMETYNLFKKIKWDMAYIAKYSPRPGTVAAKMLKDDVPAKEKSRRFHMLNKLLQKISLEKNKKFIGRTVRVLVENYNKGINTGRSEHFKIVKFKSSKSSVGKIIPVKITKAMEWLLWGQI